jgi:hypothetical protein
MVLAEPGFHPIPATKSPPEPQVTQKEPPPLLLNVTYKITRVRNDSSEKRGRWVKSQDLHRSRKSNSNRHHNQFLERSIFRIDHSLRKLIRIPCR